MAAISLADLTTLRVGGPASDHVEAATADELVRAVAERDERREPVLIVGGGSNLVVGDGPVEATVVQVATRGVDVESDDSCGGVHVRVAAGEPWDAFVARAVAEGWAGVECLAGIPGLTGATPIQNVGAYGQEVADTVTQVRAWDRRAGEVRTFANADCGFGYRTSRFKRSPRFVVLEVVFGLRAGELSEPIRYTELARLLQVQQGERAPLAEVRDAVLELRRSKGMVLDPADHDTWSAGSFFTNPVLDADAAAGLPDEAPRWPQPDGRVKTSAAWLIEHAGFERGFRVLGTNGAATLSRKHTLAVTNRGDATAADVLLLAREVRDGVRSRFGVTLEPEPTLVNCEL